MSYGFTATAARTLVATFIEVPPLAAEMAATGANSLKISWPTPSTGWVLEESVDLMTWTPSARIIATVGGQKTVTVDVIDSRRFFHLAHP